MEKLLEQLLNEQEVMLNEINRKGIRTAVATGLLGGAAFLAGANLHNNTSTFSDKDSKPITQSTRSIDFRKEKSEENVEVLLKNNFPKEYSIIKVAADRNNCVGEDLIILFAIRKAENGRAGREFGILHPRAIDTDLNTQAGWAAATIVKNRKRWIDSGKKLDFITFLGTRYCPVGAENDPKGLNNHWIKNVKSWVRKLS